MLMYDYIYFEVCKAEGVNQIFDLFVLYHDYELVYNRKHWVMSLLFLVIWDWKLCDKI